LELRKQLYQLNTDLNEAVLQQHPDLRNSLVRVLMRKKADLPFRHPMQGTYKFLQKYQN
jgi:hypothetical protein